MVRSLLILLFALMRAATCIQANDHFDVSHQYIITLKSNVNLTKHIQAVQSFTSGVSSQENSQIFRGVFNQYAIAGFQAYAAHFPDSVVDRLRGHADIAEIQKDAILTVQTTDEGECDQPGCDRNGQTQDVNTGCNDGGHDRETYDGSHVDAPPAERRVLQRLAPYNLHRISHRGFSDTSTYWYVKTAGFGTYGYVLDGGFNPDHAEFGGRTKLGFNAFGDYPATDSDGHGTYIAGIIGGKKYGVAKRTTLISVKMLHSGLSALNIVLLAYQWAVEDIISKNRQDKAVINLSVAGELLSPLNQAIDHAHAQGIVTIVPAGNGNKNAYTVSPAAAKGSITVGATDRDRIRPHFSNWGPAVMIFAPGTSVCSAWIGSNNRQTRKRTGTAAAGAHVAGLTLYFKSFNHLPNPETTWSFIKNVATKGVVKNAAGSADLFAYNNSGR